MDDKINNIPKGNMRAKYFLLLTLFIQLFFYLTIIINITDINRIIDGIIKYRDSFLIIMCLMFISLLVAFIGVLRNKRVWGYFLTLFALVFNFFILFGYLLNNAGQNSFSIFGGYISIWSGKSFLFIFISSLFGIFSSLQKINAKADKI